MEPDIKWFAIMIIGVMIAIGAMTSISTYYKNNNACWQLNPNNPKTTFNQCTGEIKNHE